MKIKRAVVGGFPRLHEDISIAMGLSIQLQLRNDIDILCDGDQRGDMITYFASDIPGLNVENHFPFVEGKISPPENPMNVKKVHDYFTLKKENPDLKFKVAISGPTTLAMSCGSRRIISGYRNYVDFSLASDIAGALREIVSPLLKVGAYIQLDEPFFSQGFRDLKERIRLIDEVLAGSDPSLCSIHVCGYLGRQPLLQELAKLENLETFSHAFSISRDREKENLQLLDRSIFENNSKKLGAGIISVSSRTIEEVESPATVSKRLEEIVNRIGLENLAYVTPDCYLRAVNPEIVEKILQNLNEGTKIFEQSIK